MNILHDPFLSSTLALDRLIQGNQRFLRGECKAYAGFRADLANGQNPFAVVVGCSDSRVPAEIVFDVGLGDLFVVRVAGNIVAPSQIGSVEFAVAQFGIRLVLVMGHTQCGAVSATVRTLRGKENNSKNLASITERIAPSIREIVMAESPNEEKQLHACVIANVRASVNQLTHGSRLLEELTLTNRLQIVGAVYAIENGEVSLLT